MIRTTRATASPRATPPAISRRVLLSGRGGFIVCAILLALCGQLLAAEALTLARDGNFLVIRGGAIPSSELRVNYIEAYCRAGSTDADWVLHTRMKHSTEVVSLNADHTVLKLRCTLEDGVTIDHTIIARSNEVDFQVVATNPGKTASQVQWAQACPRLGTFTGFPESGKNLDDYLGKCFIFLGGKLTRMPTPDWALKARYVPGQVWCPAGVPRTDVNPRPLNPVVPSNGLIGGYSADDKAIFATAWEPYQELFQGVARCLHADFRIGGLNPGETKTIRGKIYIVPANIDILLKRYESDFPEHTTHKATP